MNGTSELSTSHRQLVIMVIIITVYIILILIFTTNIITGFIAASISRPSLPAGELSTPHRQLVERNPMLAGLRLPAAASTPLSASFPNWSSRAHAFVSACLCLEPVSRPSAQELLNHEFFTHDGFPETFLPVLRQKVQQEFSTNVLLGMTGGGGRRGSSTPARRTQGRKVTGGGSPESVYGRSIGRVPQPTTTAPTTTARADATTIPAR